MTRATKRGTPGPVAEMPIGQLAKAAGVSTATINFYVAQGVLPPPRKLSRTRAAYEARHLRILKVIRRMQAAGYSLAQVKGMLRIYGTDERGLKKAESVGALQPVPAPRTDDDQRPIELFDPVDRRAFLEMADCDGELLDDLHERGILRPVAGRYDARDLWMVREVKAMLRDGVSPAELSVLSDLLTPALTALPLVLRRARAHQAAVRSRELRFTDLVQPFMSALLYFVDRLATETDPGWRQKYLFPRTLAEARGSESGRP